MSEEYEVTESVLDAGYVRENLEYGFRFAALDSRQAAGLPDNPIVRRQPYEGRQFVRLDIDYKQREVCVTAIVTMRVSKARSNCPGVSNFDAAVKELYETAALKMAEYFAKPGNTVGACNYPDEKSKKSLVVRWNGLIIKLTFRAETGLYAREPRDQTNPRDPMEPFAESELEAE